MKTSRLESVRDCRFGAPTLAALSVLTALMLSRNLNRPATG